MERPAGGSLTGAPMREFNTAGPIIPEDPYHIAPLARLDREDLLRLIERKKYFVLHAPRQTGKTTILRALRCKLVRASLEATVGAGLEQTRAYMDRCAADAGHLVVFDRGGKSWDEKVFRREERTGGARVTVWGM